MNRLELVEKYIVVQLRWKKCIIEITGQWLLGSVTWISQFLINVHKTFCGVQKCEKWK